MIWSNDIQATGIIRSAKVLEAREAIARGVLDTPETLGAATELMIEREKLDQQYDERAAERDLMDSIVGNDIDLAGKDSPFWTDPEDTQ